MIWLDCWWLGINMTTYVCVCPSGLCIVCPDGNVCFQLTNNPGEVLKGGLLPLGGAEETSKILLLTCDEGTCSVFVAYCPYSSHVHYAFLPCITNGVFRLINLFLRWHNVTSLRFALFTNEHVPTVWCQIKFKYYYDDHHWMNRLYSKAWQVIRVW